MHIADEVVVRAERDGDRPQIEKLLRSAFPADDVSARVRRTRDTAAFIPELSLVGDVCDEVLGHVLLTRVTIDQVERDVLALGPVAVAPSYQRRGIGMVLVKSAVHFAEAHGFAGIVVAGPEAYFSRLGFRPAVQFGLTPAFKVDGDSFLALPLKRADFSVDAGLVRYMADIYPL